MKVVRNLILVSMVIMLAGCMSTSPKAFLPLTRPSHFVLDQDVMVPNKLSSGLAKGRYQAVFESNDFVYYMGEPKSIIVNESLRINGGIALPKPGAQFGCHLFLVVGNTEEDNQRMGPVISKLASLEDGRIREFKNDPKCVGFMPYIHVVYD